MAKKTKTLKERFDQAEAEADAEAVGLWGMGTQQLQPSLMSSPKFRTILAILVEQPLLVTPVLNWLLQKRAEMAQAQLGVLYTPAELEALYAQARKEG